MPHISPHNGKTWSSPHGRALPQDFCERTLLMGIVNATPDSFSDGGEFLDPAAAARRATELVAGGADIIDLGAESTRPGSRKIDDNEELRRLLPALKAIREVLPDIPVSVDTSHATVAAAAIENGADILNDVCAIRARNNNDRETVATTNYELGIVAATMGAPLIAMHNRFGDENYGNFWEEFMADMRAGVGRILASGVPERQLWLDPGFGFGKTPAQNLLIVAKLEEVAKLGFPVLLGTSRKSTLGTILHNKPPKERSGGDAACSALGAFHGAACLRLHDPAAFRDVVSVADAAFFANKSAGTLPVFQK